MSEETKEATVLPFRRKDEDVVPEGGPAFMGNTGLFGDVPVAGRFSGTGWRIESSEGGDYYLTLEHEGGKQSVFQLAGANAGVGKMIMGMCGAALLDKTLPKPPAV